MLYGNVVQLYRIFNLSSCRIFALLVCIQTFTLAESVCSNSKLCFLRLVGLAFPVLLIALTTFTFYMSGILLDHQLKEIEKKRK